MRENIPVSSEIIKKMQSDIVKLSGVLGFLLKLEYGQPISITIDGATTTVIYDSNDSGQYDEIYNIVSGNYIKNMRNLALDIFELSQGKVSELVEEPIAKA